MTTSQMIELFKAVLEGENNPPLPKQKPKKRRK